MCGERPCVSHFNLFSFVNQGVYVVRQYDNYFCAFFVILYGWCFAQPINVSDYIRLILQYLIQHSFYENKSCQVEHIEQHTNKKPNPFPFLQAEATLNLCRNYSSLCNTCHLSCPSFSFYIWSAFAQSTLQLGFLVPCIAFPTSFLIFSVLLLPSFLSQRQKGPVSQFCFIGNFLSTSKNTRLQTLLKLVHSSLDPGELQHWKKIYAPRFLTHPCFQWQSILSSPEVWHSVSLFFHVYTSMSVLKIIISLKPCPAVLSHSLLPLKCTPEVQFLFQD